MKVRTLVVFAVLFVGLCAMGQETGSSTAAPPASTSASVPRLVQFSGVADDTSGKPLTGAIGITFLLYREEHGGAPLWVETQNVQADAKGHYSVQLGATKADGLPTDMFASGEARWLGVQIANQAEQPRVLLMAVPYALKAADASTIGGLPPSAFVRANSDSTGTGKSSSSSSSSKASGAGSKNPLVPETLLTVKTLSPGDTLGFLPLWTGSKSPTNQIGTSNLFQSSNSVGIGTTSPASLLDVNGTGGFRDTLTLFPKGTDPALSVQGTAFGVSNTGLVSFVSGQTFPGTGNGTITGVTAGTDLTGGGTSGAVTLNLDTTKVAQLNTSNNGTLSVTGNNTGTIFQATQNSSTSGAAVAGVAGGSSGVGVEGSGVTGVLGNGLSGAGIGVRGIGATGVIGDGTTGVFGFSSNTSGSGFGVFGVLNTNNTASAAVLGEAQSTSGQNYGVQGFNASTSNFAAGVSGIADGGQNKTFGMIGSSQSPNGTGVWGLGQGQSVTGGGVGCCVVGIWGDTSSNAPGAAGLVGTADDARAIYLQNNSPSGVPTAFMFQGASGQLALVAGGSTGACTVDTNGDLFCHGSKSAVVEVDHGQRQVALYAVEAPQNWFEDFGSGHLASGSAAVSLDPTFAQTVNTGSEYHIFLTPEGDCRGLYVSNKSASGFEVHELGGGQSNVAFSYRIVALRRGYENLRLEDKTAMVAKAKDNVIKPSVIPGQRWTAPARPKPVTMPTTRAAVAPAKLATLATK